MQIDKIRKIGAYTVITILIFMMIFSIISVILPKIIKVSDDGKETSKSINWKELYPFEESKIESIKIGMLDKYKSKIKNVTQKLENYTSENLIKYEKFVEFSYYYDKIIKYSLVSNSSDTSRIKIDDEYLTRIVSKYDTTESSKRLKEFNNYLNSKDIDFLYVQAPYKISENTDISDIYKDFSNENMDNLLNEIDGEIDYIDIRKVIQEEKLEHIRLFFKTDHHWTPKAGLWATNEISKYLNDNYNMNLNIEKSNIENYTIKTYKRMFLGADGRYVTLANTQPEDFDLLIPNFDTQLSVKILEENVDKDGSYIETIINTNELLYGDYYNTDQYSAYSYGTKSLIEITNNLEKNGNKILLIRDSFGNVVVPFLALETEYLSAIDLRSFTGSLKTYIEDYKPDIVIVMYTGNHWAEYKENTNPLWEFE